ncbi:MAG: hypothetical protein ACREM8_09305, partial [Vulcanimicrobiaceae bacterium]
MPVAPTLPAIDQGAGRGPINYGYVVDSARDSLEHAWTDSADQVERAYCVLAGDVSMSHDPASWSNAWYIHRVVPAIGVEGATPYLIHYDCPVGTVGSLHIHTPTTCTNVGASA